MKIVKANKGQKFLVDDEDYGKVKSYPWYVNAGGYAYTAYYVRGTYFQGRYKTKNISMHQIIMGTPPSPDLVVDHINRDRSDNRKSNLRWATLQQNGANSRPKGKGYKGVSKQDDKWSARMRVGDKRYHFGSFCTPEEAAQVYDKAARHFFGEFAYLNFPEVQYPHPVRYVDLAEEDVPGREPKGKSKYLGVSYFWQGGKRRKRWRAVYRKKTLGYFATEEEAAEAYRRAKDESKKC